MSKRDPAKKAKDDSTMRPDVGTLGSAHAVKIGAIIPERTPGIN